MILNATNSRTMKGLTKTPFIEDWSNTPVTVYVDNNVKHMGSIVEGLRISTEPPRIKKDELTKSLTKKWGNAVAAYKRDKNFNAIEKHMIISDENKELIKKEAE
ncbi:MAG: hypothetical protein GY853_01990 [PVC group bacterium]|nr:hypothetical protein [PVC group bacterium]